MSLAKNSFANDMLSTLFLESKVIVFIVQIAIILDTLPFVKRVIQILAEMNFVSPCILRNSIVTMFKHFLEGNFYSGC